MTATIREIVDDAMLVIGEVSGAGTQQYSEDRMMADAIRGFDYLFKKAYWPQFTEWFQLTLDGTLGVITGATTFQNVRDFEDVFAVFPSGSNAEIPKLNRRRNPFTITGTRPLFWDSLPVTDADYRFKRIQFWPKAATGDIVVGARVYPRTFDVDGVMQSWVWTDFMDLDKNMLVHGVAWMTLSSDDLNAGAATDQMNLMESRFNDITKDMASKKIMIEGHTNVPNDWYLTSPFN